MKHFEILNDQQANINDSYKNAELKLFKTNAAIQFNNTCNTCWNEQVRKETVLTALVLKVTWLNKPPEDDTEVLKPVGVAILSLYFSQIVHFIGE